METDKYFILLEKFFRKEASPEEIKELTEWINQSGARRSFEAQCEEIWMQTSTETDKKTEQDIWAALQRKIKGKEEKRHFRINPALYRIAATILLPICLGLAIYAFHSNRIYKNMEAEVVETVVDRGQKASLTLPDGTKVWLNSATKLAYGGDYNRKERRVQLEGEAYFEVAKNPGKKFTVSCNGLNIEALGTTFNVKGYQADETVSTSLLEGSVKVYNDKNSVLLAPHQRLNYNKTNSSFTKTEIKDAREIDFWRRNILYFRSASLEEIAKTLERMYGITVLFETEELKKIPFSGSIRNNSLSNVFHVISLSYPLKYKLEKDTVTITREAIR